jgi:hypothetical protein
LPAVDRDRDKNLQKESAFVEVNAGERLRGNLADKIVSWVQKVRASQDLKYVLIFLIAGFQERKRPSLHSCSTGAIH